MEALNTYTKEMTLRERVTEILSEMKMTKAELAMKIRYSRSAVSQYLGNKYSSDPTEIPGNHYQPCGQAAPYAWACGHYIRKKAVEDAKEQFKSSFVSYGKMVIYTYLPKELLPESFEDLTFDEFFSLYGQADCARDMRIEDIEAGVAKGIADNFGDE